MIGAVGCSCCSCKPTIAVAKCSCCHCKPEKEKPKPSFLAKTLPKVGLVLLALFVAHSSVRTFQDFFVTRAYRKYWKAYENFEQAIRSVEEASESDVRMAIERNGPDVSVTIKIVPIPIPNRARPQEPPRPRLPGYGVGRLGRPPWLKEQTSNRDAHTSRAYMTSRENDRLVTVLNLLEEALFDGDLVNLEPCTIRMIVEGHADGHPVIPGSRHHGNRIYRYPYGEESCWWMSEKTIWPQQRINNHDIAFLRAYYALEFINRSMLMRYVRETNIVVKEACPRGGCFRKVVLVINFENLLGPYYNKFYWTTRFLVFLGY